MKASKMQVGGNHYKSAAIQPSEFCELNHMDHLESCVVKRMWRHDKGGKGKEDIYKAIHECKLILEYKYNVSN